MLAGRVDLSFETLLQRARAGDTAALGCLLDSCRAYLKLIAASLLRTASRASVDVSDVVQETNLKACGNFPTFQGSDEPAAGRLVASDPDEPRVEPPQEAGSPGRRPESLEALLERASLEAHRALAAPGSTPSAQASRREQAVLTANALESLPPDYQQVLVLCYLEKAPAQGDRPADGPLRRGVADASDAGRESTGTETTGTAMNSRWRPESRRRRSLGLRRHRGDARLRRLSGERPRRAIHPTRRSYWPSTRRSPIAWRP